jgi:hypothetical protein
VSSSARGARATRFFNSTAMVTLPAFCHLLTQRSIYCFLLEIFIYLLVIIASYKEILSYENKFVKYFGNKNQINGDIYFLFVERPPHKEGIWYTFFVLAQV